MKKIVLSFIFLLSVFITNASEEISAENTSEILKRIATEVDPNQAQKKLRMFFKGDKDKCIEAFQQALKEENAVAQLHLANTYFAMNQRADSKKDFSTIREENLESDNFSGYALQCLSYMIKKVNPSLKNWEEQEKVAHQTINKAAKIGSTYAQLIQILEDRGDKSTKHFGTACKLKSLIGNEQQFPELLYTFGSSLFYSHPFNRELGLEGLKYMEQSEGLTLIFAVEDPLYQTAVDFEEYCDKYTARIGFSFLFDYSGMAFFRYGKIIVPSKKHWELFKKNKLDPIQLSPDNFFDLFEQHDMDKIRELVKKYNLNSIGMRENGLATISLDYTDDSGKRKKLGEVKLTDAGSKNTHTNIINVSYIQQDALKEISVILNFLQDALSRCRDSVSVSHIIDDLKYEKPQN